MKRLILVCLLLNSLITYAQTEPLNYRAAVARFKVYYNKNQPDSLFNMFSPEVKTALPADKNKAMMVQLQSQLGDLKETTFKGISNGVATYKADFAKSTLAMKLSVNAGNQIAGLLFDNYKDDAAAVQSAPQTVNVDPAMGETHFSSKGLFAGEISGTLTMPANAAGKVPVVLIVAGSGPTDRNGNTPQLGIYTNSYKMIAIALRNAGIASLRYDKRLVGESAAVTKEKDLKIEDYVEDANRMINQLHDDPRFSKVIVLGHSEGSLVGMLASINQPIAGYISVAGAGRPAYAVLKEQMKSQPDFIALRFMVVLDSLAKGKVQNNVDASLYGLARPSVQPYLMSWMHYDPARAIKLIKVPVLIVQGTTDLQVTTLDADKLKKAKSEAVLEIIPEMNHILKDAPADRDKNLATYSNPNLPLKPEFVTAMLDFINKLK